MAMVSLFSLVIVALTVGISYAQYPYQVAPPAPRQRQPVQRYENVPQQEYGPELEPEPYQPAPPQPQKRRNAVFNPATVHYVNIGAKLEGDYKFGYDTGKGGDGQSFREETRLPDGTVQGAYGYVDASGKQRIVRYTAGKDGFKAEGDVGPDGLPKAQAPAPAPARQAAPREIAQQPPTYQPSGQQAYSPPQQQSARSRPRQQPTYSQPPPQPQPAYVAPSHNARQPVPRRYSAPRPTPAQPAYEEPDYDYNNDLSDQPARVVPIDTALFNYNIGINSGNRS